MAVLIQKRLSRCSFVSTGACTAAWESPKSRNTSAMPAIDMTMAKRPTSAGVSSRAMMTTDASWMARRRPCPAVVTAAPRTARRPSPSLPTDGSLMAP